MRFDKLLDPISPDQPCGPDLEEEGDDVYVDYYYEALARVPERFLQDGQPFDRKEIDIKAETKAIAGLLDKSRDLRLLVLEAKFQILSGSIKGFSECLQAVQMLCAEHWDDVHPRVAGGVTERKNQIELLDDRSTIIMPLEHAPLFRDRRIDQITYRDYQVASGKKDARAGEKVPDAGSILSAMKSAENAEQIDSLYALLKAADDALRSIVLQCKSAPTAFAPQVENLEKALAEVLGFLVEARPDLVAATEPEQVEDAQTEPDLEGGAEPQGGTVMVASGPPKAIGAIANHAGARKALQAVEEYYMRVEPSSPGLILIRQARLLIGKPLMVALETLLPNVADQARIDFGSENGFNMTVPRMKMLSEHVGGEVAVEDEGTDASPPILIENRDQASAMISNVESFFRQTEPSSPVPILLFKAKTFLNRDFSAIISDLFAHLPAGS